MEVLAASIFKGEVCVLGVDLDVETGSRRGVEKYVQVNRKVGETCP
jgi:hypothetical protein